MSGNARKACRSEISTIPSFWLTDFYDIRVDLLLSINPRSKGMVMKQSMLLILFVVAATVFSALTGSNSIPTIQGGEIVGYGKDSGRDQGSCRHYRKRAGYNCR